MLYCIIHDQRPPHHIPPPSSSALNQRTNTLQLLTLLIAQRQQLPFAFTYLDATDSLDGEIIAGERECFFFHVEGHWLGVAL